MRATTRGIRARLAARFFSTGLIGFAILLVVSGCGGSSSSSSDDEEGTQQVSVPLGNAVKNVQLEAGKQVEIRFTQTYSGDITASGDFSVNLARTLQNASLSAGPTPRTASLSETLGLLVKAIIKDAIAAETAQVRVYISSAGDPNVCASPINFGPYSITGAIGMALTSSTANVSPDQLTIDIMNSGALEVCIVTIPPIDAYLNLTGIEVDVEPCAPPTVSIAGSSWQGTYQCQNFGTPDDPPGSFVSLTIAQNPDGSFQYTDDFGAVYNGHLCGNRFKFNGGFDGFYTESGTMIFINSTTATKTSTWNGIPYGTEGGNCSDELSRTN